MLKPTVPKLAVAAALVASSVIATFAPAVGATPGTITTVAGSAASGFGGDGAAATAAALSRPFAVASNAAGDIFIADAGNARVRRVDAVTGFITTVAGSATFGFSGDGGPATSAELDFPAGLAVATNGDLFISDDARIRKVDVTTGIISTVAGTGAFGFSGDGGPATAAQVTPAGLAFDPAGRLVIADSGANRIRRLDFSTGLISTVAGNGSNVFSGDGGVATAAGFTAAGVAVDPAGNLFIADAANSRIRRVDATTQIITTYAGSGTYGVLGDGGPATGAQLVFPSSVAIDFEGDLFIAGTNTQDTDISKVRMVSAQSGNISTVAGSGTEGFAGDAGPATAAQLSFPRGVAIDRSGNLLIADTDNNRVRSVAGVSTPSPVSAAQLMAPLSPLRVFDTRPDQAQGLVSVVKQKYGGANILRVKVTGTGGVPDSGVGAVSLNVTVAEPDAAGFVTVFPCGDRPTASSLNYTTGQVVPNAVIAPISPTGEVCFFSSANTHLLADVNGWFAT